MARKETTVIGTGQRLTEPERVWRAYGGYGIMPRPSAQVHTSGLTLLEGSGLTSTASPMELLEVLGLTYPPLAKADNDEAGLLLPPEGLQVVAVDPAKRGSDAVDEAGTAALDELWQKLPPPVAGLNGLFRALLREVNYTGIAAMEATVDLAAGVTGLYVVSGRSIWFGRESPERPVIPYHRLDNGGYVRLDRPTFFWQSWEGTDDRPYGFPRRWPVFNEALQNITLRGYQRDAMRHVAWPRLVVSIAYETFWKTAIEHLHMSEADANDWVADKVRVFMEKVESMKSDDTLFVPADSSASVIEGGAGLANAEGVLTRFERSEVQGLFSLPGFFGINDSTTETTIKTQLDVQARTLERPRTEVILRLILQAADLHLRLLGLPLVARCDPPSIFHDDEYIAAQTEELRTQTLGQQAKMGVIDGDTLAEALAGRGLADPERFQRWLDAAQPPTEDTGASAVERRKQRVKRQAENREKEA